MRKKRGLGGAFSTKKALLRGKSDEKRSKWRRYGAIWRGLLVLLRSDPFAVKRPFRGVKKDVGEREKREKRGKSRGFQK